jgi:hypothetical protein
MRLVLEKLSVQSYCEFHCLSNVPTDAYTVRHHTLRHYQNYFRDPAWPCVVSLPISSPRNTWSDGRRVVPLFNDHLLMRILIIFEHPDFLPSCSQRNISINIGGRNAPFVISSHAIIFNLNCSRTFLAWCYEQYLGRVLPLL